MTIVIVSSDGSRQRRLIPPEAVTLFLLLPISAAIILHENKLISGMWALIVAVVGMVVAVVCLWRWGRWKPVPKTISD
jgi:hypothetical protein